MYNAEGESSSLVNGDHDGGGNGAVGSHLATTVNALLGPTSGPTSAAPNNGRPASRMRLITCSLTMSWSA